MSISVTCFSCRHRFRVPEHRAGRRGLCPHCQHTLRIPLPDGAKDHARPEPGTDEPEVPLPLSVHLGMAATALGLLSVMVLCLPVIGYASVALSGGGLLLGLAALACSLQDGGEYAARRPAGAAPVPALLASKAPVFPLAGTVACLLALVLALLPVLLR